MPVSVFRITGGTYFLFYIFTQQLQLHQLGSSQSHLQVGEKYRETKSSITQTTALRIKLRTSYSKTQHLDHQDADPHKDSCIQLESASFSGLNPANDCLMANHCFSTEPQRLDEVFWRIMFRAQTQKCSKLCLWVATSSR